MDDKQVPNQDHKQDPKRDQNQDYTFVQETIKKKPVNKKKLVRRTVITAVSAVIFGLVACLTFLLLEPIISQMINPESITKVKFPEEEVSPEELLTEESVAQQEEAQQEAVKEEVKQEIQQSVSMSDLSVESYEKLYSELYSIALNANKSMVTVIGITEKEDWFKGTFENENFTSGMIVANNGAELLILADSNDMLDAAEYHIRFCNNNLVSAELKQKDSQTGLAIYAVDVSKIEESTLKSIQIATLGNSVDQTNVGKPVIAVGAPLGTADSVTYGMITSSESKLYLTDAVYNVLMTDMSMGQSSSGVVIDMKGEVLGVIANSTKGNMGINTISTLGISELKPLIAKLSNNEHRSYIGIKGMDVTKEAHDETGVPYGTYVSEVASQSPAMKAGILNGDVIVHIGSEQIISFRDFREAVFSLQPQTVVEIELLRFDGTQYNSNKIELTTGEAE